MDLLLGLRGNQHTPPSSRVRDLWARPFGRDNHQCSHRLSTWEDRKLGNDSRYIMLSCLTLENCLGNVVRAGYGQVWNGAERQQIVQLKRYGKSKHVICRCFEEEHAGGLGCVTHGVS